MAAEATNLDAIESLIRCAGGGFVVAASRSDFRVRAIIFDHTVRGALTYFHATQGRRDRQFRGIPEAEIRGLNQATTQDIEATLAIYSGRSVREMQQGLKA